MLPGRSPVPVVVCDMGTDTTRLGYAGNDAPTCVLPTLCAWTDPLAFDTLRVGHDAHERSLSATSGSGAAHRCRLLDHGAVVNWDLYEEYWRHLFNTHLCVESSDVGVVLAEAARASPEQRETMAEILFESFGVAQLSVGSQALFALSSVGDGCDTGVVVMGGAGVTQVVPVVDGYAIDSAAQRFPIAGRDVTQYILDNLRARERSMEAGRTWAIAERVKTRYAYVAREIARELARFEADASAHVVRHEEVHHRTGQPYCVEVGNEQFLAPEVFFHPGLLQPEWTSSLADVIDAVVWSCPIDSRRCLYTNLFVCGGGVRFPKLPTRIKRELHDILRSRADGPLAASGNGREKASAYEVHVRDCSQDLQCVWKGGSVFGASERYALEATTRAEYQERGYYRAGAA